MRAFSEPPQSLRDARAVACEGKRGWLPTSPRTVMDTAGQQASSQHSESAPSSGDSTTRGMQTMPVRAVGKSAMYLSPPDSFPARGLWARTEPALQPGSPLLTTLRLTYSSAKSFQTPHSRLYGPPVRDAPSRQATRLQLSVIRHRGVPTRPPCSTSCLSTPTLFSWPRVA